MVSYARCTEEKSSKRVFVSEGQSHSRDWRDCLRPGSENWGYPPTVASIRGIPFFGVDPVVKIGGTPLS